MASTFEVRHQNYLHLACPTCQLRFIICRNCFRGHKYCSEPCRDFGYRQKLKTAKKKYAAGADSKRDHADRNRVYRIKRKNGPSTQNIVMDRSSTQSPDPVMISKIAEKICPYCMICGRFFSKGSGFEDLDPQLLVSD